MTDFFDGQDLPESGGIFTKLQDGTTRLRVLSGKIIMSWEVWDHSDANNPECNHYPFTEQKPAKPVGQKSSVRHCGNMVVWNYETQQIEVWQCSKASILKAIKALAGDEDFGHPKNYDLKITKSGSNLNTEYSVVGAPPKPLGAEIKTAAKDVTIDLNNIFHDADGDVLVRKSDQTEPADDVPFAEEDADDKPAKKAPAKKAATKKAAPKKAAAKKEEPAEDDNDVLGEPADDDDPLFSQED